MAITNSWNFIHELYVKADVITIVVYLHFRERGIIYFYCRKKPLRVLYKYQVGGKLAFICAFPGKEDVILFMDSLERKVYYLDLSGWIPILTRRPIKLDAFSSN